MYDVAVRKQALAQVVQGRSINSVSKQTGISRSALRCWQTRLLPLQRGSAECPRCIPAPRPPADAIAYAYLLGLYLGDGHIVSKPRQHHLSISCGNCWPGLIDAAEDAMRMVMVGANTRRSARVGCTEVKSYTKHWTCLFPQHGPGKKHERRIVLADWQQEIVDGRPWELVRGLIHSDGCRFTNWTTRVVGGKRKRYEYPRYYFTNKSDDIRRIFTDTLDRLGVEWTTLARGSDPYNISIARRASVALMDAYVGPKY